MQFFILTLLDHYRVQYWSTFLCFHPLNKYYYRFSSTFNPQYAQKICKIVYIMPPFQLSLQKIKKTRQLRIVGYFVSNKLNFLVTKFKGLGLTFKDQIQKKFIKIMDPLIALWHFNSLQLLNLIFILQTKSNTYHNHKQ